jgi:hypothetical protein
MRLPVVATPDATGVADADGWERRFIAGPPRLAEVVELYRSLGHEVRLESVRPDELERHCRDCALALALFRVVCTRRRP